MNLGVKRPRLRSKRAEWKLEAFLYFLIKEHLPVGKIDEIMTQIKTCEDLQLFVYPSVNIRNYAHEILEELILETVMSEHPKEQSENE